MVAMGSYVFKGLIKTVMGLVQWFEETTEDEDYVCQYNCPLKNYPIWRNRRVIGNEMLGITFKMYYSLF
jgi:hypothetical protein